MSEANDGDDMKSGVLGRFISREECAKMHEQVGHDLKIIQKALVGEDLRGGLVKDVSDMKTSITSLSNKKDKDIDFTRSWKLAVLATVLSSVALLASEFIRWIFSR